MHESKSMATSSENLGHSFQVPNSPRISLLLDVCPGPVLLCRQRLTSVNLSKHRLRTKHPGGHRAAAELEQKLFLVGLMMPRGDCGDLWAVVFASWHHTQQLVALGDWGYQSWIRDQYLNWISSPFLVPLEKPNYPKNKGSLHHSWREGRLSVQTLIHSSQFAGQAHHLGVMLEHTGWLCSSKNFPNDAEAASHRSMLFKEHDKFSPNWEEMLRKKKGWKESWKKAKSYIEASM